MLTLITKHWQYSTFLSVDGGLAAKRLEGEWGRCSQAFEHHSWMFPNISVQMFTIVEVMCLIACLFHILSLIFWCSVDRVAVFIFSMPSSFSDPAWRQRCWRLAEARPGRDPVWGEWGEGEGMRVRPWLRGSLSWPVCMQACAFCEAGVESVFGLQLRGTQELISRVEESDPLVFPETQGLNNQALPWDIQF